ncbi:MAG: TlpA family protein disulfide reductase [Acidobacteriota bacterium]|nr:TlpA family protein disulfide reductase [Acidobacteriota bacterium]
MKRTVALVLVLALFAVVSCKRTEQKATQTSTTTSATAPQQTATTAAGQTDVGTPMPEYAALNLDGSKFDLAAKRDKVVLLNVWATWCGPCVYEIPELQQIHEKYSPRGLEVIGVSVDESGVESVREFVAAQEKMTYPIVLDESGKIANLLETTVLPTSIVVDRKGQIVWKKYGAIMEGDEELKKAIEGAL